MIAYGAIAGAVLGLVLVVASGQASPPQPAEETRATYAPTTEREAWAVDFLRELGNEQPTPDTIAFVVAWQTEEGTTARFNPLATSQDWEGATVFNSHGVKEYASYQDGIAATVRTLQYSYTGYAEVLEGLRTNDPERALAGLTASPWAVEAGYGARVRGLWEHNPAVSLPTGAKYAVTPTMEVSSHFEATDCGSWGFQAGCMHWGTDYWGEEGTPVYAPFDLTILAVGEYGPGPTWGQYVQGTFADGYVFYAGHLKNRAAMAVGKTLPAGTLLGYTNGYNHTHVQLGQPGDTGACAQRGACVDFDMYWQEH